MEGFKKLTNSVIFLSDDLGGLGPSGTRVKYFLEGKKLVNFIHSVRSSGNLLSSTFGNIVES